MSPTAQRRHDVTTLGELVIDLIPLPSAAGPAYAARPGGAPANVAAGVARLGGASAMISKVGCESFGSSALAALRASGVDVAGVARTALHNTALAVTSLGEDGQPSYVFYRDNCADTHLSIDDIPVGLIEASRILHVGTLLLAAPVSADAQRHALARAKTCGTLVSADVNFRATLWRDPGAMRSAGLEALQAANIVKLSEDELTVLAGPMDTAAAVRSLWHPGLMAVAVTKGVDGADMFTARDAVQIPGFPVRAVDTIGCGDAFMASFLLGLAALGTGPPDAAALRHIGMRACAAGAIVATLPGALESMPSRAALDSFLSSREIVPGRAG